MASLVRNHTPSAKDCHCSACGAEANAPPGKPHRKCGADPKGVWRAGKAPVEESAPISKAA